MKTATKRKGDHVQELTVTLDGTDLGRYVEQARKRLAASVSVDGFRKGKAPDEVATQHLSDESVRQAALELAVEGSFSDTIRELGWDVAKTERLNVVENDAEQLVYTVAVSLWPAVSLGDLSEVAVTRNEVTVTGEQVTEALDTLRNMKATFLDKEGAVAEGDRVEVDFTASVGGKPVPGGEGKGHPLVVGGKTFMPGFEEQLIGLRKGDTKTFSVTAPQDYAQAELAGKDVSFNVTVQAVQIVMRPDITDEFAKELKYENTQALTEAARQSVLAQGKVRERDRVRLAIMDAIAGRQDIPTPTFLVDEEADRMLLRFEQDLAAKGLTLDMYLSRLGKSRDDIKQQWCAEAERQVRMSLIVRQVVKEQGIKAAPDEIDATLQETIARLTDQGAPDQGALDTEALRRTIEDRLVTEKALSFLEQTCARSQA